MHDKGTNSRKNIFTAMDLKAMSPQIYKKLLLDPCQVSWSILLKFKYVGVLNCNLQFECIIITLS